MRGCSRGLQEVPIFVQERGRQGIELLPKLLQSLVLLLLLSRQLLLVIVDVKAHPVIHHSHHGFLRDGRITEDLEDFDDLDEDEDFGFEDEDEEFEFEDESEEDFESEDDNEFFFDDDEEDEDDFDEDFNLF